MSTELLNTLFWNSTPTFLQTYVGIEPVLERLADPATPVDQAKRLLHRLAYRPSTFSEVLRELPYLEPLVKELSLDPMVALKLVAENPKLFPTMKERILSDVEAAAALYMLSFVDPLFPKQDLPAAKDFFLHDPEVLIELGGLIFESVALPEEYFASLSDKHSSTKAGWAVHQLRNLEYSDEFTVPSELVELLSTSEFYSLSAARILRDKAFGSDVYAPLLNNLRSARYTYRALAEGLDVQVPHQFEKQLRSNPAWLIEHLTLNDAPLEIASAQYLLACEEASANPLIDDLHEWYLVVSTAAANRSATIDA